MPWLVTSWTAAPTDETGVRGKFRWFRPDADVTGEFNEVPLPSNVVAIDSQVSWAGYQGAAYGVGGWTDNVVFTSDFAVWAQGIDAPTAVPTVALAAGPGITAEVICYLRYYDETTGERSPLSGPSATLSAANQSIAWTALPTTPINARVTHIEGWRSVDGSLPRFVWRRQIGATSVTEAVPAGSLGEAFTEDYSKFPRCRYNAIWHERQVMAGNDEHPDTIFFSLIGHPEQCSTISLRTKSGQTIVGLVVVRDTLIVLCPNASEIVSGYTEDDIQIQIAQPHIGGISHWATQVIHGLAFIWADLGLYLCDGSSWFYLSQDIQSAYQQDYQSRRLKYERSWAVHDPASYACLLYAGNVGDWAPDEHTGHVIPKLTDATWTLDYNAVIPLQGGNFTQPSWSWDTFDIGMISSAYMTCGAVLAVPGGRRGDAFFGNTEGRIVRYVKFNDTVQDFENNLPFTMKIRHGADAFGDVGGDAMHGKRFSQVDMFVQSEEVAWTLSILGGDEWIGTQIGTVQQYQDQQFHATVPASEVTDPIYEVRMVHSFRIPSVTGRRVVLGIDAYFPFGTTQPRLDYSGYQLYWLPGPTHRKVVDVQV